MPQELRVVRCFQCLKYQVDIVKKANKWVCKLCGVKQSLTREFFRGSGKDCRSMVQQLSMRTLEMDQKEAEVASLVLQNKIQLPEPPMQPVSTGTATERCQPLQGPSKWETFLTTETNDDLSEAVCFSESFESVSSTSFDRERINNPKNNFEPRGASQWNYQRLNKEDPCDNEEIRPSSIGKYPSPRSNLSVEHRKPTFNPVRSATNTKFKPLFQTSGAEKRCNYSTGNDSMVLPNLHREESTSRKTFRNRTKKIFSQANVAEKSSNSQDPSASRSNQPPEMPRKRKFVAMFATPLMNFGKRDGDESKLALSAAAESKGNDNAKGNDKKPPSKADPASVSSKWAKYLPEDDETNGNTDNNFIIF